METTRTTTNIPFAEASEKNWFLSTKPVSPKQTISVAFENGKTYKYLGTSRVKTGDPVVIDWGGATSYHMGNVDSIEDGVTIKKAHALKTLFVFSTDPDRTEIKRNGQGMSCLEDVKDIESYFNLGQPNSEDRFRIIDFLVTGVLNAITVVAFPALSKPETVKAAKEYLKIEKTVPSLMFTKEFTDHYYGEFWGGIKYAEQAEVALTGFYPGWMEQIKKCKGLSASALKSLGIEVDITKDVYYMYFSEGSQKLEKYFSECDAFKQLANELVMRSALSVLIRGGFVNLLKAALSTQMPIKSFYHQLIAFADEIGSKECSALLKTEEYEKKAFDNADKDVVGGKKIATKDMNAVDKAFRIKDSVLLEYKGSDETVIIPNGVKTIGESAFCNNATIKKAIIPDSVTRIKENAFFHCESLKEVVLGKNVSSVGVSCFKRCKSLTTIDFSNTKVKKLAREVFEDCSKLKSLDLSQTSITTIEGAAFCFSGLYHIIFSQNLEFVGSYVFCKTKVAELMIPATVTEIHYEAFVGPLDKRSALKRIVFEGTEPIRFHIGSVSPNCVIACKKGSALMKEFEKQNQEIAEFNEDLGSSQKKDPLRKLEEI